MAKVWGVSIEEARDFARKHNIQSANRMFPRKESTKNQENLIATGTMVDQIEHLKNFNIEMSKKKKAQESAITKLEQSRFGDMLTRRSDPDPIIKVKCTKPKTERMLTLYITRRVEKGKAAGQYTEVLSSQDLVKLGYNEWLQLLELVNKKKGKYFEELRLVLERLITKVKDLALVLNTSNKTSSSSVSASMSWKRTFKDV
ncbi:unnamed protein product [Lactuca virosa]|uniref:Uncharacterized protein n=1 Tax=Lactuca virosa TaxID=75947 RepID=A0AAU9LLQ0_9ASTR|nr:unnamed protein product [Lactuca virosa]